MEMPTCTSTMLLLLLLLITVCGQPPLTSRIVGGQNAIEGDWPWMVSLHRRGSHFCGASLINNQWLLTAAHCFGSSNGPVTAYLGRLTQSGPNPNEVSRNVDMTILHPNYNPSTFDNDVALLRLASPVTFNNFIRPVCLADTASTFFTGTDSWVTGWGRITEGGALPNDLMEVEVPVIGNRQCNCDYNPSSQITENMICAGLRNGGKDACQGDSGGPMVSRQGTVWVQSGVVSFGEGCARPERPGVYARVSQYQAWISNELGNTNLPGFVTFTSPGTDPDLGPVTCNDQSVTSGTAPPPPPSPSPSPPSVTDELQSSVTCGNAPLNTRLSGPGVGSAPAGFWPWMASLHFNGSHRCGGTLVDQDVVLTSAQCVSGSSSASDWTVFLGRLRQIGSNSEEVEVNVTRIITSRQPGQNVALLTLASPVPLSNFIQPICIESVVTFDTGSSCWAAGWSAERGGEEQILQEIQTEIVDCVNISSTGNICTEPVALDQSATLSGPPNIEFYD
nr:serine protease 27-like [Nerophis lumbriciformis]